VPSRQDQLHSYQYSLQRVVAALVTHDPDPHRSPLRRAGTTALVSVVVAALAVTGAAIWGVLTGAGTGTVTDESALYVEKGTGARYVFRKSDGRLHPVLNYTSGLLIADSSAPNVVTAAPKTLAKVPLGDPLGIPEAPDSLPEAADLLTGPWSICTQAPEPNGVPARPRSTLVVGRPVTDGVVVAASPGAGRPAQGLLVQDPADHTFLIYGNRRFLLPADRYTATLRAFKWADRQPWPVAAAWINAIPLGPDIQAPAIADRGRPSGVPQTRIGRLLTDGGQWAVALADGVAPVTAVQALLLQTDPDAVDPVTVGESAFNNLPQSRTRLSDAGDPNGLPSAVPDLGAAPTRACMTLPVGRDGAGLRLDPTLPAGSAIAGGASVPGAVRADVVSVPRGAGAVVVAAASPTAPAGTGAVFVVTDTGRRYPLAGRDLLGKLGYGDVTPQQVPAQLIAVLPEGPSLDPARARQSGPGDGG
jgi:type VII secretion protein EccB